MGMQWKLQDLVDLEYFLQKDENRTDAGAGRQERDIAAERLLPVLETKLFEGRRHRRDLLRLWLEERRRIARETAAEGAPLPGELFNDFNRLAQFVSAAAGTGMGFGAAMAFLHYRGAEPLNVWTYLGLFVFLQIGLLALFLFSVLLSRGFGRRRFPSLLRFLLGAWLARAMDKAAATMTAERRGQMRATMGLVLGKTRIYGAAFSIPVFIAAQLFGVGFNLGVSAGTLLRVIGSDLAFGWQSTVQWSDATVFGLVKIMALPWSWIIPVPPAYPTMVQVAGSRMFFKNGMHHLATQDLVSWWPFLIFAVVFYGLLPRLLLLLTGITVQRRLLARLSFNHSACDQLVLRLAAPVIEAGGAPQASVSSLGEMRAADCHGPSVLQGTAAAVEGVVVLMPVEISAGCLETELQTIVRDKLGLEVVRVMSLSMDAAEARDVLKTAAEGGPRHVVILQEAWQPPIFELLRFYKEARKILGSGTPIGILLIGRPTPETVLTRARSTESEIWCRMIAAMGDPYLGCYNL